MADSPLQTAKDAVPEIAGWMAGEYRLGRKLGEGGFGAVYEAMHPLLKRRAAVKVLHRIAGSDSDAVLRFVAEARAVNQIKNRHIIDIFSFGKLPDGRHFYVMDLLEGEPLDRYLAREGRCSVETTVQLLRPIAEALDAAHAAGVVHRDLKPQNIYLVWDESGETVPKLLDFGMAKLLGDSPVHTASGTPLGTPLYMSPEQARGDPIDGRSDIYSLGVLCHELLTGSLPITGENTIAVLMAHIIQTPPRVSEVCPDLSPTLDAAVLSMLEKKAEARPGSASAALAELSRAAEGAGCSVPAGPPHLSRPPPGPISDAPHSHGSADTALHSLSPNSTGFAQYALGGGASPPRASSASAKRARWPLWVCSSPSAPGSGLGLTHDDGIAAPSRERRAPCRARSQRRTAATGASCFSASEHGSEPGAASSERRAATERQRHAGSQAQKALPRRAAAERDPARLGEPVLKLTAGLLALLALLGAGCTDFPNIPSGECGNGVIEPGEDCDTFALGAGSACRAKGMVGECHLDCAVHDGHAPRCPEAGAAGLMRFAGRPRADSKRRRRSLRWEPGHSARAISTATGVRK